MTAAGANAGAETGAGAGTGRGARGDAGAAVGADTDADPDDGRPESRTQRADRNWNDILQELRVSQTGTQIVTGFLLTLPFQQRFADTTSAERVLYLVLVLLAALSTGLGLGPVALHRGLFQRHEKAEIVRIGNRMLIAHLYVLSSLAAGVVLLVGSVVAGAVFGIVAAACVCAVMLLFLVVIPGVLRRRPAIGAEHAGDTQPDAGP